MKTTKRIIKNFVSLLFSDVLTKILEFIYIALIGRYLGVSNFGIITFWLSLSIIVKFFTDYGSGRFLVREISRDYNRLSDYFNNIFSMKLILIFLFGILTSTILLSLKLDYNFRISGIIIISSLCLKFLNFELFFSTFRAFERMEFQAIGSVINSGLKLGLTILGVYMNVDIIGVAFIQFISSGFTLLYCLVVLVIFFTKPALKFNFQFIKGVLRESVYYGLTQIFLQSYEWIESSILFWLFSSLEVGYYNAAYKLIQPILVISILIGSSVFPVLSKNFKEHKGIYKQIFAKFLKISISISIIFAILFYLFAENIILIIYGVDYLPSVKMLRIFSWVIILNYIRGGFVRMFETSDSQRSLSLITGLCLVLNVGLNYIFATNFGIIGVGIARLITISINIILFLIMLLKNKKELISKRILFDSLKLILIGFTALCFGFILIFFMDNIFKSVILYLLISSSIITLIYLLSLVLFKVITQDELSLLKNLIKKRK